MPEIQDTIIIGGGQSALACAYFLRKTNLSYLLLDDRPEPGGAWLKSWTPSVSSLLPSSAACRVD
ncbi:NAD(P)-binding protein [Pontibacter ummariensis]|uniref:NAD(P)-binding protein n=1 Tax=Pontibacter ummariensis TaxID=1610492 RepID=UPI001FE5A2C0|nr:FAD/NAD(P)-binding protein [Pontibacter ummariensis]